MAPWWDWEVFTDLMADYKAGLLSGGGAGASSFLGLTDTPAGFGPPGSSVVVNPTGDGLIFLDDDHTIITGIDLKPTASGTPNEYTVAITWTNAAGVSITTEDPTPIQLSGANIMTASLTADDSYTQDFDGYSHTWDRMGTYNINQITGSNYGEFSREGGAFNIKAEDGGTASSNFHMGEENINLIVEDTPGDTGILIGDGSIELKFGDGTDDLRLDGDAGLVNQVLTSRGPDLAPIWQSLLDAVRVSCYEELDGSGVQIAKYSVVEYLDNTQRAFSKDTGVWVEFDLTPTSGALPSAWTVCKTDILPIIQHNFDGDDVGDDITEDNLFFGINVDENQLYFRDDNDKWAGPIALDEVKRGVTDADIGTNAFLSDLGYDDTNGNLFYKDTAGNWAKVPTASYYQDDFVVGDWTAGTPNTLSYPAATHGLGKDFLHVTVYDSNGDVVTTEVNVDQATGDVTLRTTGATFDGSVLISR